MRVVEAERAHWRASRARERCNRRRGEAAKVADPVADTRGARSNSSGDGRRARRRALSPRRSSACGVGGLR